MNKRVCELYFYPGDGDSSIFVPDQEFEVKISNQSSLSGYLKLNQTIAIRDHINDPYLIDIKVYAADDTLKFYTNSPIYLVSYTFNGRTVYQGVMKGVTLEPDRDNGAYEHPMRIEISCPISIFNDTQQLYIGDALLGQVYCDCDVQGRKPVPSEIQSSLKIEGVMFTGSRTAK